MVEVIVGEKENLDQALRRFRRQMIRSGLFKDMRRKRYYVKPSEQKKEKEQAARSRARRARRR